MINETKNCRYCLSEIHFQASKCKVCMEWQYAKKTEHQIYQDQFIDDNSFDLTFGKLKKPFQLQLLKFIRLPYYFSIFIIVAVFFTIIQVLWLVLKEDVNYLFSFSAYCLQMMVSWISVIWIYKTIRRSQSFFLEISAINEDEEARDKGVADFKRFNRKIFNRKKSIILGIIVGSISVFADHFVGLPFSTIEGEIIFSVLAFFNMFFGGAILLSMFEFGRYTYTISKQYYKNKFMTLEQKRATSQIGLIHLKSSLIAIIPLTLGIAAKLFGDWEINNMVIYWYSLFTIMIVTYIFWPMKNIHYLLKKDRDIQIIAIQMKIREKLEEINENLSSTNLSKISELRELEKKTALQKTWPFDTRGLWLVFLSIIFPIALMILSNTWLK